MLTMKVVIAAPFSLGMKPDQKPLAMGSQGLLKAAWATEWLLGQNLKVTVSPSAAVMLAGSKVNELFPTTTRWSAAEATPAKAAVAAVKSEKRIMIGCVKGERLARLGNESEVIKGV